MKKEIELSIWPQNIDNFEFIKQQAAKKLKLRSQDISIQIIRKSIDSRKRPVYKLRLMVYKDEKPESLFHPVSYSKTGAGKKVIVIGSGPAGLFGALRLIEEGITPLVVERGKDVQSRRKDLRKINLESIVDEDSNYCFGEGGAGTYSDGKLYTRSTKRGDVKRILNLLIQHGADKNIIIEAHPHIGSNRLPKIIKSMRTTILENGGEFHFDSRVTDLILKNNKAVGVVINDSEEILGDAILLATGHSARDIYYLLDRKKIRLEAKPFAMGVRIEHPQPLIDSIQYHSATRPPQLPAATYSLTCQVDERGVYSFCMCPGGILVPASTAREELVLNGMSVSRRDSPFANSGLVVSVNEKDWKEFNSFGIFAGLEYQKMFERKAYEAGGKTQTAPAQRITDFVSKKISADLPVTSYKPGTVSAPLHELMPKNISVRLKKSLLLFDKKMKGYFTNEAQILAPESRTSSPLRIPRGKENYMHVNTEGLFPAGEGAGYAGGIVSAAIDGENCASAISRYLRD